MSATVNAPFGLRPSYSPSGVIRPTAFTIASGYASNIFQNQPVRIAPSTGGGETEGTIVASAVGAAFIGTFQGVRSPGTAYVLLHHVFGEANGVPGQWRPAVWQLLLGYLPSDAGRRAATVRTNTFSTNVQRCTQRS